MDGDHTYIYELLRRIGLSDFGARTGEYLLVRPLTILLIVVGAIIAGRLATRAVRRFIRGVHQRAPARAETPRLGQRADTIADVAASVVRTVVLAVALLMVLDQLGVSLAPLIAGAGIAGLAVGFGAQSLVRDVLSGMFIVFEDQYGVGDIVTLDESSGTVEDVTLRVTRLRAVDGTVWFVPNGEIRRVGNSSMEWSRAIVDVSLPRDIDLVAAVSAMSDEANQVVGEERWAPSVLQPPEMWGVQTIDRDTVTVRLVVRTAPREQFALGRELRGRLADRLRREGIRAPGVIAVQPGSSPSA